MRKLLVVLACAAVLGQEDASRAQEAGMPRAEMRCDRIDAPGRVRCEAEVRVAAGESIATADVIIVRTPRFVRALRGRIGPHDATTREPDVWRWALALAALERGSGDVEARARLVVCRKEGCEPREAPILAHIVVGE